MRRLAAMFAGALAALAGGVAASAPLAAQRAPSAASRPPVVVASKPFGESYLLCELFAQLLESRGIKVERRPGLGATEVAFDALRAGAVDVYPEYTGTGLLAILHDSLPDSLARDPRAVYAHVSRATAGRYGARWLPPLGFENTYAIAVTRATATRYRLRTLSDLAREAGHLTGGLTADFTGRPDGLAGLRRSYGLNPGAVKPLAPALKYQALAAGAVDFIDGYSTDGLLAKYDLVVLEDDRRFFPPYQAAALVGARLARERPDAIAALTQLSGRLDESTMRAANRRVEVEREEVALVARDLLAALALAGSRGPTAAREPSPAVSAAGITGYVWRQRAMIARLTLRQAPPARRGRPRRRGAGRGAARPRARTRAARCGACARRAGGGADDPQHRAACVHDPVARRGGAAGARRALALRAVSHRPRHLRRRHRRGPARRGGRRGARNDRATAAARGAPAPRRPSDHGRRADGGRHHSGRRDARGLHRRGRLGGADRHGPRACRHAAGALRRGPGGVARARDRRAARTARAAGCAGTPAGTPRGHRRG